MCAFIVRYILTIYGAAVSPSLPVTVCMRVCACAQVFVYVCQYVCAGT